MDKKSPQGRRAKIHVQPERGQQNVGEETHPVSTIVVPSASPYPCTRLGIPIADIGGGRKGDRMMIPEDMATRELARAEAEIVKWEYRVARHRERLRFGFYGPIDRDLAEQILATFEAALADAYRRRNRLLE